jgi:hypothetical protein
MSADVFISHSSTDKKVADTICDYLERKGISCWMAPRNILPGEEWGDSILRGIQTCRIMVLVFSKTSNDSGPVRSEVDRAVNARKILIPFRIENVAPTGAMEFHIGRRHWLEAYTKPMERHLALLERTVHEILNPVVEGSVTVTLPSETVSQSAPQTILPPPLPNPDDVPLRVLLNFNHVVVTGYPSTFQAQIEHTGIKPLQQIEIVLESRGLEAPVRKNLPRLSPGQSVRHVFEIEPLRSGNFALQCTIKYKEGTQQIGLVGSRSLRINESPGSSHVAINADQIKGNSSSPETTSDRVAQMIPAGGTLNDLLNLELPERFEPLDLVLDYELSLGALNREEAGGRQRLQIPASLLDHVQAGTVLKLQPVDQEARQGEIRLSARTRFILGRSREEADFLTWFWPRGEVNDQKTRRLSKQHCILELRGPKIFVRDNETSNGTAIAGEALNTKEGEALAGRTILKLAETYSLDVNPFSSFSPEGPAILNLRNWNGPKVATPSTLRGSVRFIPMTPQVLAQNSVWVLSDGAFGTSRANPIIVDISGVAEIQGRVHHHLGNFWIESAVDNGGVSINGARLDPGFIAPLTSGQLLKLGAVTFRVTISD